MDGGGVVVVVAAGAFRTVNVFVAVAIRPAVLRTRRTTLWEPAVNDLLTHGELVESCSKLPSPLRSHSHSDTVPPDDPADVDSAPERVIGMPAYAFAGAVITATGGVPTGTGAVAA